MNRSFCVFILAFVLCFVDNVFGDFQSFQEEANRATKELSCQRPKISPASSGLGALYGCITGPAETVKFFINEVEGTGSVKNVKLMWNDWFIDVGYGKHADKKQAEAFVKSFAKLYAPKMEKELLSTFFANTNKTLKAGSYQIAYTFSHGPKIDERLLVVTPQPTTK